MENYPYHISFDKKRWVMQGQNIEGWSWADVMNDEKHLQESIFSVTSIDDNNTYFGTAFVIFEDDWATYLITCQHVVSDVGGADKVMVDMQKASVVSRNANDVLDVAILKTESRLKRRALSLCSYGNRNSSIYIPGFQRFGDDRLFRVLEGKLGRRVSLESQRSKDRVTAWEVGFEQDDLQHGYSGSPVINGFTGQVIGILSHRKGTKEGLAIDINQIQKLWPKTLPGLLFELITNDLNPLSVTSSEEETASARKLYLYFSKTNCRLYLNPDKEIIAGRGQEKCNLDLSQHFSTTTKVSRGHFKVFYANGHHYIVDLGSSYGTYLDEFPLRTKVAQKLYPNQIIRLAGDNSLSIEVQTEDDGMITSPNEIMPTLKFVLENLQDGQDVILFGQAGLGKNKILRELEHRLQPRKPHIIAEFFKNHENVIFLYINCPIINDASVTSFFRALISATKLFFPQWPDEIREGLDTLSDPRCSIDQIQFTMKKIIRIIHERLDKGVVILLNDFDLVFPDPPKDLINILAEMKSPLAQVNYIFAVGRAFKTDGQAQQNVIDQAKRYWIKPFETEELVTSKISRMKPEEIEFCLKFGSKQPELTRLVAEYIKDHSIQASEAMIISRMLENKLILGHCYEMWKSLSISEQDALCSIVGNKPNMTNDIQQHLVNKRGLLLQDHPDGTIAFENPLFEAFIYHIHMEA